MTSEQGEYRIAVRRQGNAIGAQEISDFEVAHGCVIPMEYKLFLMEHNGGSPMRSSFKYRKGNTYCDSEIRLFVGIRRRGDKDASYYLNVYKRRIPSGLFPIAIDTADNLILVSTNYSKRGEVYFWDHDSEPQGTKPTRVSSSLKMFLKALKEPIARVPQLVCVKYANGKAERRAEHSRFYSIDRNTVVNVLDLRAGERVEEFGEQRVIERVERASNS